jgi:hypothetical protein
MDFLINILNNDPSDITYLTIGSAFLSNVDSPDKRQQFPPFIETQYNNKKKIRIINIDPKFEKPYFMKRYLPNLIEENNQFYDRLYHENLEVIYISTIIELNEETFLFFDIINKIIMAQNNILIVVDFTGRDFTFIEKYFYYLYDDTDNKNKFNNLICYDFMIEQENTCTLNMINNYPIIENNRIIKFNFIDETDFLIKIENKKINNIHKKIFIAVFYEFINTNFYVYRNLINKNINQPIIKSIPKSIFKNINIETYSNEELFNILLDSLYIYNDIIYKLFKLNNYLMNDIDLINIIDDYQIYNNFISLSRRLSNYIKN